MNNADLRRLLADDDSCFCSTQSLQNGIGAPTTEEFISGYNDTITKSEQLSNIGGILGIAEQCDFSIFEDISVDGIKFAPASLLSPNQLAALSNIFIRLYQETGQEVCNPNFEREIDQLNVKVGIVDSTPSGLYFSGEAACKNCDGRCNCGSNGAADPKDDPSFLETLIAKFETEFNEWAEEQETDRNTNSEEFPAPLACASNESGDLVTEIVSVITSDDVPSGNVGVSLVAALNSHRSSSCDQQVINVRVLEKNDLLLPDQATNGQFFELVVSCKSVADCSAQDLMGSDFETIVSDSLIQQGYETSIHRVEFQDTSGARSIGSSIWVMLLLSATVSILL